MNPLFLGIDVGTSGVRACLIDASADVVDTAVTSLPPPVRHGVRSEQDPQLWWHALEEILDQLAGRRPLMDVAAIAVDGTSPTLLACSETGDPLGPALLYNDLRACDEAMRIAAIAPPESAAHGAHSSLAKALWLSTRSTIPPPRWWLHQSDWLTGRLLGRFGGSDENNAIKLGFDARTRHWPEWICSVGLDTRALPNVRAPGSDVGSLHPEWIRRWGMTHARVVAGTTDSTAAFLATGASRTGQAVTSLGSTLVLKVLADRPVFAPHFGVYSQRLGDRWLVGGGSNSGGAVLRQFFSDARLLALEARLQPERPTGLDYYPLPAIGERFPISDPTLAPRLLPRPDDDARFLQGLLEGMAAIERRGYTLLHELGAPYPSEVISSGGGARNSAWRAIRAGRLGVPVALAAHQDAAYGAALLALRSRHPKHGPASGDDDNRADEAR